MRLRTRPPLLTYLLTYLVANVENCRFPASIDALQPTRSSFPQPALYNLGNFGLFLDPVLHLNVAFMWKG